MDNLCEVKTEVIDTIHYKTRLKYNNGVLIYYGQDSFARSNGYIDFDVPFIDMTYYVAGVITVSMGYAAGFLNYDIVASNTSRVKFETNITPSFTFYIIGKWK